MPLDIFFKNLLNVIVQAANKKELQNKIKQNEIWGKHGGTLKWLEA
jgi:hypothetical protein